MAACNATILLPQQLKPGDTLSPDARITSADGRPVQGPVSTVWYIGGRQTSSATWDGRETAVTLQLSCQGQAQEVSTVLPAYLPVTEGGGPNAPLPPVLLPPGMGVPGMGGVGNVPGPKSLGEALVGALVPAAIGLAGALVPAAAGLGETLVTTPGPCPCRSTRGAKGA